MGKSIVSLPWCMRMYSEGKLQKSVSSSSTRWVLGIRIHTLSYLASSVTLFCFVWDRKQNVAQASLKLVAENDLEVWPYHLHLLST